MLDDRADQLRARLKHHYGMTITGETGTARKRLIRFTDKCGTEFTLIFQVATGRGSKHNERLRLETDRLRAGLDDTDRAFPNFDGASAESAPASNLDLFEELDDIMLEAPVNEAPICG